MRGEFFNEKSSTILSLQNVDKKLTMIVDGGRRLCFARSSGSLDHPAPDRMIVRLVDAVVRVFVRSSAR